MNMLAFGRRTRKRRTWHTSPEYRPADDATRDRFQLLQALEDAIAYRRARVSAPCPDCQAAPQQHCDDHARDLGLIADYRQAAAATIDRFEREVDPDGILPAIAKGNPAQRRCPVP